MRVSFEISSNISHTLKINSPLFWTASHVSFVFKCSKRKKSLGARSGLWTGRRTLRARNPSIHSQDRLKLWRRRLSKWKEQPVDFFPEETQKEYYYFPRFVRGMLCSCANIWTRWPDAVQGWLRASQSETFSILWRLQMFLPSAFPSFESGRENDSAHWVFHTSNGRSEEVIDAEFINWFFFIASQIRVKHMCDVWFSIGFGKDL
jgi:hypothetical protein